MMEISKLAKRVTGTASTDMSAAAPVLMLCLFLCCHSLEQSAFFYTFKIHKKFLLKCGLNNIHVMDSILH